MTTNDCIEATPQMQALSGHEGNGEMTTLTILMTR